MKLIENAFTVLKAQYAKTKKEDENFLNPNYSFEHKIELSDLKMRNISEERIKKLIEIADKARLERDRFKSGVSIVLLLLVILIATSLIIAIFNPAKLSLEQLQYFLGYLAIYIPCMALTVAVFSFSEKPFQVRIIDSVKEQFQRLSKNVKESEKILLRALITMKIKQPDVSLTKLYNSYPSMFDEETIVKRMYS